MNLKLLKAYLCSSYKRNSFINGTVINSYNLRYNWIWDKTECRLFHQYKNVPEIYKLHFSYSETRKVIHVVFHFTKSDDDILTTTTTFNLYLSNKKFKKFCRHYIKTHEI